MIEKQKHSEKCIKTAQCCGASLITAAPLFTIDVRFIICASGKDVKVFSIENGELVSRLVGHTDLVTKVCQHPKIKLQILSSSLDSTIRLWDYEDGVILKTFSLRFQVYNALAHQSLGSNIILLTNDKVETLYSAINFSLETQRKRTIASEIEACSNKLIAIGKNASYIACAYKKCVTIADPIHKRFSIVFDSKPDYGEITCITANPANISFATGHSDGSICIWHNFYPRNKSSNPVPAISQYHWHPYPVGSVTFTPDAAYMLSVGNEGVLVQWHYKYSDKKRKFFPRIGYPMNHVVVSDDGLTIATSHRDNSIQIISNSFWTKQTIEGFTVSYFETNTKDYGFKNKKPKKLPCGLHYDWKSQSCVTNGKHGHLLFYQPVNDKQLYNLDIVGQNYVMKCNIRNITQVTNVALTSATTYEGKPHEFGHWMATVEERKENKRSGEQRLKIWIFDEVEQRWSLKMLIHNPHKRLVKKIMFRPASITGDWPLSLVTAGTDGQIKIWEMDSDLLLDENDKDETNYSWICATSTSYRKRPILDFDISQDGSMFCAAFGGASTCVTVTNIDDLDVLKVVATFPAESSVRQLCFGRCSCQTLITIALDDCIVVFDVLQQSIKHVVEVEPMLMQQDQYSDLVAVFTKDHKLLIMKPSSPTPIYTLEDISEQDVIAACFLPNSDLHEKSSWFNADADVEWMNTSRLFYVLDDMTIHCPCTSEELKAKNEHSSMKQMLSTYGQEFLKTPMASIIQHSSKSNKAKEINNNVISDTSDVTHRQFKSSIKRITETPCHVLPSMTSLCQSLLTALLVDNDKQKNSNDEEEEEGSDSGSSDVEMESSSSSEEADVAMEEDSTEVNQEESHADNSDFDINAFSWVENIF